MGTKMAPSYANLFLGFFEANALKNAPFQPHTWLRYIDDIFMIWTEGLDNLKIFIDYLNNIHSTIKFISSHSSTNIPFLGVNVSLTNDGNLLISTPNLQTNIYSIHPAILYIQKKPFLSVLHSVYDVSVLPTLHFILALLNLPLTSLNEVTTVTSSTNKYDAPQTSPANSLYKPKTSTNLNEYHS